ncbi:hypothetical protein D9M68_957500 [compost metagenome]
MAEGHGIHRSEGMMMQQEIGDRAADQQGNCRPSQQLHMTTEENNRNGHEQAGQGDRCSPDDSQESGEPE